MARAHLEQLLAEYTARHWQGATDVGIYALHAHDPLPAAVTAFVDHLGDRFAPVPPWDLTPPARSSIDA